MIESPHPGQHIRHVELGHEHEILEVDAKYVLISTDGGRMCYTLKFIQTFFEVVETPRLFGESL